METCTTTRSTCNQSSAVWLDEEFHRQHARDDPYAIKCVCYTGICPKMDAILVPQPTVDAEHATLLAQNSVTVINLVTTETFRQPERLQ